MTLSPPRSPWLSAIATLTLATLLLAHAPSLHAQGPLPVGCQELLQNGGFETDEGWILNVTQWSAALIPTEQARSGQRALLLSLAPENVDEVSNSIAQQSILLPTDAAAITLTLSALPVAPGSAADRDYVLLLSSDGQILTAPLFERLENAEWQQFSYDLTEFGGQEVVLQLGVYNDGEAERAAVLMDDVSLVACSAAAPVAADTPTATPTPTVTASATPSSATVARPSPESARAAAATPAPSATATPAPSATATPTTPNPVQTISIGAAELPSPSPEVAGIVTPADLTPTARPTPIPLPAEANRPGGLLDSEGAPILVGTTASLIVLLGVFAANTRMRR